MRCANAHSTAYCFSGAAQPKSKAVDYWSVDVRCKFFPSGHNIRDSDISSVIIRAWSRTCSSSCRDSSGVLAGKLRLLSMPCRRASIYSESRSAVVLCCETALQDEEIVLGVDDMISNIFQRRRMVPRLFQRSARESDNEQIIIMADRALSRRVVLALRILSAFCPSINSEKINVPEIRLPWFIII